jgi:hypothetical protein
MVATPFYANLRRFSHPFSNPLHRIRTAKMASIRKQEAGTWRVQVRRKGRSASENFVRYEDAKRWSVDAERQIDRGETPTVSRVGKLKTLSDLIDLHIRDMKEVGKAPGRTKEASLAMLKRELGSLNMVEVDRERIVKFGRARAKEGAGPVTLSMDVGLIKLVLQHVAAVHGLPVKVEPVDLGRVALKRLRLIGKSNERDRPQPRRSSKSCSATGTKTTVSSSR